MPVEVGGKAGASTFVVAAYKQEEEDREEEGLVTECRPGILTLVAGVVPQTQEEEVEEALIAVAQVLLLSDILHQSLFKRFLNLAPQIKPKEATR